MSTEMQTRATAIVTVPNTNFAVDPDGMPIYLGTTEDQIAEDWDTVYTGFDQNLWELAAIAAKIVTVYGENNIGKFAYAHKTSGSWIRQLAKTYRTFENGRRISMLSFYHHLTATNATNPVKAVKVAHDREYSTRELKDWIYKGEGRNSPGQAKALGSATKEPEPEAITVEGESECENFSLEDEPMTDEDRSSLLADIEMGLRLTVAAQVRVKTKFVQRYFTNLQEELDYELKELTKAPEKMSERIESLIRGGCWIPSEIMRRAKINSNQELNYICRQLESDQKIKWSRERKRKHGTAPAMWMPFDMPDGDEFEVERSRMDMFVDSAPEEHF